MFTENENSVKRLTCEGKIMVHKLSQKFKLPIAKYPVNLLKKIHLGTKLINSVGVKMMKGGKNIAD